MNKERDIQFDIVRVIATLWIVACWHVKELLNMTPELKQDLDFITISSLATFMFMSGYFLSKYSFNAREEVKSFYRKRFVRFYPLFALSAVVMFLLGDNPGKLQLVLTLTGLSTYLGKQPWTLWFISMLFSFYMLTPLISRVLKRVKINVVGKILLVFVSTAVIVWLFSLTPLDFDNKFAYAFPAYCSGLILGTETIIKRITSNIYILVFSGIILALLQVYDIHDIQYCHIDTFFGVIVLLCIAYWMTFLPIRKTITFLSYTSMSLYLFHRPVYRLLASHCPFEGVTPYYIYLVMIPVAIIVSYIIQYSYDFCVNNIEHRKNR